MLLPETYKRLCKELADVELAPKLMNEACRQRQVIYGFRPEYYLMDAAVTTPKVFTRTLSN